MQAQATESLDHARQAGELVTWLGGHPSLAIGPLLESHQHDIGDIMRESLTHEGETLKAYEELLGLSKDKNVRLEEYARDMIALEVAHQDEVRQDAAQARPDRGVRGHLTAAKFPPLPGRGGGRSERAAVNCAALSATFSTAFRTLFAGSSVPVEDARMPVNRFPATEDLMLKAGFQQRYPIRSQRRARYAGHTAEAALDR
jgi:hypothetical protein